MVPVYLFQLASQHMAWLAQRQSVIAANIAHADTPGYRAREVLPFAAVLGHAGESLSTTHAAHLALARHDSPDIASVERRPWDQSHSGNTVSVERELIEASQSVRMMNIDAAITRSFHRMILTSLKG